MDFGIVFYKGLLYVAGGSNAGTMLSSVETFDGSTWSSAPPISGLRSSVRLEVLGEYMYAIGGESLANGVEDTVRKFDGTSWSATPSLLQVRAPSLTSPFAAARADPVCASPRRSRDTITIQARSTASSTWWAAWLAPPAR